DGCGGVAPVGAIAPHRERTSPLVLIGLADGPGRPRPGNRVEAISRAGPVVILAQIGVSRSLGRPGEADPLVLALRGSADHGWILGGREVDEVAARVGVGVGWAIDLGQWRERPLALDLERVGTVGRAA